MKTLLIIDDEPEILELLIEEIKLFEFDLNLITASNFNDAKSKISNCQMVLSDINIPKLKELEDLLKHSNLPVARMSGYRDVEAFGIEILTKPYKSEELEKIIKKLITISESSEEKK